MWGGDWAQAGCSSSWELGVLSPRKVTIGWEKGSRVFPEKYKTTTWSFWGMLNLGFCLFAGWQCSWGWGWVLTLGQCLQHCCLGPATWSNNLHINSGWECLLPSPQVASIWLRKGAFSAISPWAYHKCGIRPTRSQTKLQNQCCCQSKQKGKLPLSKWCHLCSPLEGFSWQTRYRERVLPSCTPFKLSFY